MSDGIDTFLEELRRANLADRADDMALVFKELDFCANTIPEACALYDHCLWLLKQPRTAEEKFNAMVRLNREGISAGVTMQQWTGWK